MSMTDSPSTNSDWLSNTRKRFGSWKRFVAAALTVVLTAYLVGTLVVNRRALLEFDWHITPSYLVASSIAYCLSLFLGASAWHRIVYSMDKRVPYRKGVKYFLQSSLAKRVPGFIWYALGRLYLYQREGVDKATISVALILELVSIMAGGMLVYGSTAWTGATAISEIQRWWAVFPLAGLAAVIAWPKGLYTIINWLLIRTGGTAIDRQAGRVDLVQWSLFQAGAWLAGGLFVYLLSTGIYPDLKWSQAIGVVNGWAASGLVALMTLIIPLGLGLKEITLAYLLSSLVPWPIAVVISLLTRVCSIIGDCLGLAVAHWL